MKFASVRGVLLALGVFATASCLELKADDYYVTVDRSFSPSTLTINVGDSVTWINYDDLFEHSTTSDGGFWNVVLYSGDAYTYVFEASGTYTYYDIFDGFRGTIIVRSAANTPPSVSITAPAANTVYQAPASFSIAANASDSDGSVASVQFYVGGSSLGTDSSSPYQMSVSSLAAGTYTLTAVATDNLGAKGTNSISIVVNSRPSVSVTNPVNNAVFSAPANITLKASASDTDGTISQVQFFSGATSLGTVTAAPYNLTVNGLGIGSYAVTARATDNRGGCTTSAVVNVVVTSVAVNGPKVLANRQFQLGASGLVTGKTNVLQYTTSFGNWVNVATNVAGGATATLTDTTAMNAGYRFYRVIQLP